MDNTYISESTALALSSLTSQMKVENLNNTI